MNLEDIFIFLGMPYAGKSRVLQDVRIDSRKVQPGDLFVGVPGNEFDGRNFAEQALQQGAAAVLVEADEFKVTKNIIEVPNLKKLLPELAAFFYKWPSEGMDVIGITGTNGKTSTSHYLAQILASNRIECGIMGTLGIGIPGELRSSNLTTSDSCTIQRELANFLRRDTSYVAMEVSSHALQQQRLDFVKFSTAVFTNLSQDHLDYHVDMEAYFAAKSRLFSDFYPERRVINIDDPYGMRLLDVYSGLCYSIYDPTADVYAEDNKIYTPWGTGIINNPLVGDFNLSNILACISVCGLYDLDLDLVLNGVKNLQAVPGRMQKIQVGKGPMVVVDYAHTPDALSNALQALLQYSRGEIYCIFGCGGDRDKGKRPLMLSAAVEYSDHVVVTQDNPRNEDPESIVNDIFSLCEDKRNIRVQNCREKAIRETILQADVDDIILVAGKGHEDYQIIGAEKRPFSDVKVVREALVLRGENVWQS